MGDRSIEVHCDRHGTGYAAFVCHHLLGGSGLGFFYSDNGPCPDAWCAECDALMMQTGHWTEEAEKVAGISIVCNHCYRNIRRRNLSRRPKGAGSTQRKRRGGSGT